MSHSHTKCLGIFALLSLLILPAVSVHAEEAKITIKDSSQYHVHAPGQPFTISLTPTYAGSGVVSYHWVDYKGDKLTDPVALAANRAASIVSPTSVKGYYGLVLESDSDTLTLPNRRPQESREWGFTIFDKVKTTANPSNKLGIVQADYKDPYIGTLVKSLTWMSTGPEWMDWEVKQRAGYGKVELPIIAGGVWDTDDKSPVAPAQLHEIKARALDWFDGKGLQGGIAPQSQYYWELGIEENLSGDYSAKYYWTNLAAKAKAVREAAVEAGKPGLLLVYQVAGLGISDIRKFLKSEAAPCFDVMSIHPYAWSPQNFTAPDEWFDKWWAGVQSAMTSSNWSKPVWFTEVGAPVNENSKGAFFGYPDSKPPVKTAGLTRLGAAEYMVKLVTVSLQKGVSKIFWYNYMDNGTRRDYAEHNFGMRENNGYPRVAYGTQYALHTNLEGKEPAGSAMLPNGVKAYRFDGAGEDVYVMWSYPGVKVSIPLGSIREGLKASDVLRVVRVDAGDGAMPVDGDIVVGGSPILVAVKDISASEN